MPVTLTLPFPLQPDLAATMDIQIPALAWQPCGGGWERTYRVGGAGIRVTATEGNHALLFRLHRATDHAAAGQLKRLLRAHFPRQVATLSLPGHPALTALRDCYQGVVIMAAEAFEALVVTILSQNRTGEITRKAFGALDTRCGGVTAARLAAISEAELRDVIRSAGPYKAPRLLAIAQEVSTGGPEQFTRTVRQAEGSAAMSYLTALPGVAHKTAACVMVFAAQSGYTLPVDTHLFRVAGRLGLAPHDGKLSASTRDRIVADLLAFGPDMAAAHFLFLLLGRSTCTSMAPRCSDCLARAACPTAAAAAPPASRQ